MQPELTSHCYIMDAHLLYRHQNSSSMTHDKPTPAPAVAAGPHTAFFYGTLMAPPVLYRVCYGPSHPTNTLRNHSQLSIRPALLKGFRRHRVKYADYPGIVPCASSTVRGTLVTGLTDGDVWRLDVFEGDEYERRNVAARIISDKTAQKDLHHEPRDDQLGPDEIEAQTYVWVGSRDGLDEEQWDFEEFVREKMWRWAGEGADAEGEYNEVDEAVEAQKSAGHDPTRGRSVNGAISKALEEGREEKKDLPNNAV
jgi:Gamma-glutamyl cyclotransferase, AIG2-like